MSRQQDLRDYLAQLPYPALLQLCDKHALLTRELLQRLLAEHLASPAPSPAPSPEPEPHYRSAH